MLFNEVRVIPTQETVDYLSMLMSGSSLPMDPMSWSVVLNQSNYSMEVDTDRIYEAKAETLNVWYDDLTGQAALLMVLKSQDLVERAMELREQAPNPLHASYYPNIVMLRPMPQLKRRYKALINSWGDTLVRDQTPLIFEMEFQIPVEYNGVPEANFYADMDRRYNIVR